MAWDRRSRSLATNSRGRGAPEMNSVESTSSLHPWACSSLSSSEKFLSLYEKMQDDRERKNLESLLCAPCIKEEDGPLQEGQQRFPALLHPRLMTVDRPGNRIAFPHITSRGSLVGKKVYCRTAIQSNITLRQKSSTQRMHTSLMILNFYQDRSDSSNRFLLGRKEQQTQSLPTAGPADSVASQGGPSHALDREQCRGLFLSIAGAAGMRLICPPVQLPLLEILLFFREQLSRNRAAAQSGRRGGVGLWRFPVKLALAMLKPFSGSIAGRCLTALLCLNQMRFNNNCVTTIERRRMSYTSVPADLESVMSKKECDDLDLKKFTKIYPTSHFQIADHVVTITDADNEDAGADKAEWNYNDSITLLSKAVLGPNFEEECCSNSGVQVVEILLSESEDSLSDDTAPKCPVRDNEGVGSDSGHSEDSEFSLVYLQDEDLSPQLFLKLKESEKSSSEVVLVNGLSAGAEEATNELFSQHDSAVSHPSLQFLSLEVLNSFTAVNAEAELARSVPVLEEDAMPLTVRMSLAEKEQPCSVSRYPITPSPKTSTEEVANDEDRCSVLRERDEAVVVLDSKALAEETVENPNAGIDLHGGKFVHFAKQDSVYRLVEQEVEACFITKHITEDTKSILLEGLQEVEVSLSKRTTAESKPEQVSSNSLQDGHFEVDIDGGACVSSEQSLKVCLTPRISDGNGFDNPEMAVLVERLVLVESAENQTVLEPREVKAELCVTEEESAGRALDSSIQEHRLGGKVCLSSETFELLMEASWIGARKELVKAVVTVPSEKPVPASIGVAKSPVVKKFQDGQSTHSVWGKSAAEALDQALEVCPSRLEVVGIQEVRSEHRIEEQLEKEHRFDADDGDGWLESLLEQVEVFISERADLLSDHEKAAIAVVENEAIEDIQEVQVTSVEEEMPKCVLDQKYRFDDGTSVPSERLQGHVEFLPCYSTRNLENELDETECPTPSAVNVAVEKLALPLMERVENEVKEIHEVKTIPLTEKRPADELLNQDLAISSVEEHRIGDRDNELLEVLRGECDVLSERTSAESEAWKAVSSTAALAISVEGSSFSSTEVSEDQFNNKIDEEKSSDLVVDPCEESVVNLELEVCSIEGHGINDRSSKLFERLQAKVDVSLPSRVSTESEPKASEELRERKCEVSSEEDPRAPRQEESNYPNSSCSNVKYAGQAHDLVPSSTATTRHDSRSEEHFSSNHFGVTSTKSCPEHPESKLICEAGEFASELCTQISLTSRLLTASKAADNNLESGAIAVVLDDEQDGSIVPGDDNQVSTVPTETIDVAALVRTVVSASDENGNLHQSTGIADEVGGNESTSCVPETCSASSPLLNASRTETCYPEHPFADHPTCIELRKHRYTHGDQTYIDMQDLLAAPWGQLIFWHGRCKEGRPTLCVLLGKAVRQLPGHDLKNFVEVAVSHVEYAELNFFKGNVKQMNILMDLEGLGFMRLPPMHVLSAIGAFLNRDYAGRGGWMILLNAPLMLGFVISSIQGIILRPAYNDGAVVDSSFKGFLDGKERILTVGGKYRSALQKHFDFSMLPVTFGGDCCCRLDGKPCELGSEFLKLPWDPSAHTKLEERQPSGT